jgi:hypothetical protein
VAIAQPRAGAVSGGRIRGLVGFYHPLR